METMFQMASGTFRLKSREMLEASGKSLYRVAKDGDVAYSTLHRWLDDPEAVERIDGKVLFGFLVGLGYSIEEINGLPLGQIFEFTSDEGRVAE